MGKLFLEIERAVAKLSAVFPLNLQLFVARFNGGNRIESLEGACRGASRRTFVPSATITLYRTVCPSMERENVTVASGPPS